jgi:hypothetical protein
MRGSRLMNSSIQAMGRNGIIQRMKMKGAFLILFVGLVVDGVSFAQSTWKGLRFGMSEAEVRKSYTGALRKEVTEGHETVLIDDSVELLGAALSVRAKVELSLGKANKLEVINITAKDPFADDKDQTSASGSTEAAIEEITSKLVDKYGKPLTEDDQCNLTTRMLLTHKPILCNAMWKSGGQNIKLSWSAFDGRLKDFIISYQPEPTDF